ncbi:MAG: DUF1501 domain-containing protein [Saccharospirillaceae bacterium]|nr:DUF1501 domain-containing protein [Pseudomonadales bacterium]NRB80562.1 DUF1501 domain-containing protein [Saccharospirillaceae bacterium]
MQRRNFLKSFSAAGLVAGTSITQKALAAADYEGPIFITLQARGGWDVTSLCDPKTSYVLTNRDGTTENILVNRWSETLEIGEVTGSEIKYAPFAQNEKLFTNHAEKMMILNGIDMQTNSHQAGTINTWSGRFSEGLPTFTALVAQAYGQGLPMAFVSNGGYAATSGIISPTLLAGNSRRLRDLVTPNKVNSNSLSDTRNFIAQSNLSIINQFKQDRLDRLLARNGLPFTQKVLNQFSSAQSDQNDLQYLQDEILHGRDENGDDIVGEVTAGNYNATLSYNNQFLDQIELTLAAGAANLMVAADLTTGGFDTHGNHDNSQANALRTLTDGVDFLWKKAEALGIDNRIRLVISSEFSRTPKYNDSNGKDHWPVNSMIFMQKPGAVATTGREIKYGKVFGASSDGHRALQLNPTDLSAIQFGSEDENDPKPTLQPKHVHRVLRRWAGIENDPFSELFDLDAGDLNVEQII